MSKFFDMNDSFCMPKNKFNMHDIVSEYIILKYLSVKSNKTLPYEIEYLGKSYAMTLDFSIKTTESFSSINQIFANIISNESIDNYSAIIGLNHVSKEDRISLDNVKANMERNVLKEWSEMGVTLDIVEDLDTAIQNYDIHITSVALK